MTPEATSALFALVAGVLPVWDQLSFVLWAWYQKADVELENRYYE